MFITRCTFEMHLNEISKSHDIVSLEELVDRPLCSRRQCAITFDDGWLDNYQEAFPVLKKFGAPATIFLPVAMIGSGRNFWFTDVMEQGAFARRERKGDLFARYYGRFAPAWKDRGAADSQIGQLTEVLKSVEASSLAEITFNAYEELGQRISERSDVMTWEQVREMGEHDITFGSHGLRHSILTTLDGVTKREEIVGSLNALLGMKAKVTRFLSYPNGNWDGESVRLAKGAGYRGAVTTKIGFNKPGADPFLLKRIGMHEDIANSPSLFRFRMLQALIMDAGRSEH
jgi:peptidoglycan/xylan/chitin deacetylase (PgdA/CDA1 family)